MNSPDLAVNHTQA